MSKLKIAAILAGEPRFCLEFDYFLKSLKNYESIDWFMYFWKTSKQGGTHGFDLVGKNWLNLDYNWAKDKIENSLPDNHKLVSLGIGNREDFTIPAISNKAGETNVERMWGMYNSIYQCDLLRRTYEQQNNFQYDMIIRARPDIGVDGIIDLEKSYDLLKTDHMNLITPNTHIHGYGHRINDMLAIGSNKSIGIYCDSINWLDDYHRRGILFHPETMLAYHCQNHNIKILQENWGNILLRQLGTQVPNGPYVSNFGQWDS